MSYTIRLKTSAIQMGKTSTVNQNTNPTANNSSDFNLVSLNISNNLNLKYLNGVVGVLHSDASGNIITKKVDTSEFADYSITSVKLANSISLSGVPTAPTASSGTNSTQIATTEFVQAACSNILGFSTQTLETLNSLSELATAIDNDPNFSTNITTSIDTKLKPFTDTLSNVQPVNPIIFRHITSNDISYVNGNPEFTLSTNIRHIVDFPTKIILPSITSEGIFYSLINKSGNSIVISTALVQERVYNSFLTPEDGDDSFELDTNLCLELISIISNGIKSWKAYYY